MKMRNLPALLRIFDFDRADFHGTYSDICPGRDQSDVCVCFLGIEVLESEIMTEPAFVHMVGIGTGSPFLRADELHSCE